MGRHERARQKVVARNEAAVSTIARAVRTDDMLEVTSPSLVDAGVLDSIFEHPR